MTLRDRLNPSENEGEEKDLRETAEDKITIYLWENKSGVEVAAYHDTVFKFLRNMVEIFWDVAEKCDCDTWEKIVLLIDWINSMEELRDKWFKDFKRENNIEDDDDDE